VNRTKTAGINLTEEEYRQLLAKIAEREKKEDKRISVSTFLRDTLLPILNGASTPESIPPDPKNVSPEQEDTFSEFEFKID
jgi:hypothetical protein